MVVDARGLPCPLPIVRLAAALRSLERGAIVRLVATDPGVEADLRAYCEATGHVLGAQAWKDGVFEAELRVGP